MREGKDAIGARSLFFRDTAVVPGHPAIDGTSPNAPTTSSTGRPFSTPATGNADLSISAVPRPIQEPTDSSCNGVQRPISCSGASFPMATPVRAELSGWHRPSGSRSLFRLRITSARAFVSTSPIETVTGILLFNAHTFCLYPHLRRPDIRLHQPVWALLGYVWYALFRPQSWVGSICQRSSFRSFLSSAAPASSSPEVAESNAFQLAADARTTGASLVAQTNAGSRISGGIGWTSWGLVLVTLLLISLSIPGAACG